MIKIPLGLSVLFLLGLAAPASAIVMAQKDLPPPPCNCVWDFVNNPFDDPIQTLAEQEEDRLHEGDPDWFLVCDFIDIVVPFNPLTPLVPTVTPFGPGGPGIPGQPPGPGVPGGPPIVPPPPPVDPPIQTAEPATLALLLVGLLVLRVRL